MIACILCGGWIEILLISCGLKYVYNWLKRRHNKDKCPCCQKKEHEKHD